MKADFTDSECPTFSITIDKLPAITRELQTIFERYVRPSSAKTLCCTLEISRGHKRKYLTPEVELGYGYTDGARKVS
jgi:hypothetical protein